MRMLSKSIGLFLITIMALGIPVLATGAGDSGKMKSNQSPYWYKPGEGPMMLPSEQFKNIEEDVRMHTRKGIDMFQDKKFLKALDHFEMATKLNPDNAILLYNQAMALHRLERHREATVKFEEAKEAANGNQVILKSPTLQAHLKKTK